MDGFIYYLFGWLIFSIGFYIYKVYIEKDNSNKKLIIYRSCIFGIVSWLGILFAITTLIVVGMFTLNEWIENKLDK